MEGDTCDECLFASVTVIALPGVGPLRGIDLWDYGVVSSPTVQEVLPSVRRVQEHRHSLISGRGGPSNLSVRNFPVPVGDPTRRVLPFAVGAGTLHEAQALASQRLPEEACGSYGPIT